MSSFRVLTVDDDAIARRNLRDLVALDRECDLIGEAANGADAIRLFEEARPDILFVDVQMPDMDGFEVARAVSDRQPLVILTSGYGGHAVRAFEERVFDYVLKPFERGRVGESLRRAKERVEGDNARNRLADLVGNLVSIQPPLRRIAVRQSGRVIFVSPEEIDWIEAANNYACLHCGHETHVLRETMSELEARLDAGRFVRVHRSAIVNIDRIRELQPWFRGDYRVILLDGTELTLTKHHRARLDSQLLLGSLAS